MLQLFFRDTQKTHLCQRAVGKRAHVNVRHTARNKRLLESALLKATHTDCLQTIVQQHLLERTAEVKGKIFDGLQAARCAEVSTLQIFTFAECIFTNELDTRC